MRFRDLIPKFARPYVKPIYKSFKKVARRKVGRDKIQAYWIKPWDTGNLPITSLTSKEGHRWSQFLVEIIKHYAKLDFRILEVGCGSGRNLSYLYSNGFRRLSGVEISSEAVKLLTQYHAEMATHLTLYNSPIEEVVRKFKDDEFDLVYTMAVFQHIHPDSEWIFQEIVRITKVYLLTIENEKVETWRHFPRNYKNVFESHGMRQVEEIHWSDLDGESTSYFGRVFSKNATGTGKEGL